MTEHWQLLPTQLEVELRLKNVLLPLYYERTWQCSATVAVDKIGTAFLLLGLNVLRTPRLFPSNDGLGLSALEEPMERLFGSAKPLGFALTGASPDRIPLVAPEQ